MNATNEELKVSVKEKYAFGALLVAGILFVLFIGSQQSHSLNSNPLPIVNKAAQEQCLNDMLAQHLDISGVNGAVCRGK